MISLYGEPHRQRSLVDYSPWSPTESDTSGCTHTHPYFQTHGGDGVEAERYFALNTAGNTWTEWWNWHPQIHLARDGNERIGNQCEWAHLSWGYISIGDAAKMLMCGYESWTVKKAEHQRIEAFELWCWRRFLRVPWMAGRSNQSILKEISSEY